MVIKVRRVRIQQPKVIEEDDIFTTVCTYIDKVVEFYSANGNGHRQSQRLLITLAVATGVVFFIGFVYMVQTASLMPHPPPSVAARLAELPSTSTNTSNINTEVADRLKQKVRVLCWVMTGPTPKHHNRSKAIKDTWGSRCNKLLFMSSQKDPELGTIALKFAREGRNYLWAKTRKAFQYVYKHHFNEADWFMKTDDDTFVILENLRYLLKDYDPEAPIYFGCRFKPYVKQGYMSGGAGYVLSKEALRRLVKKGFPDTKKCRRDHGGAEDAEMGKCLENVGVRAEDSRDAMGRYRFNAFKPETHLNSPIKLNWYKKYTYYPQNEGKNCCSDTAISFHYIEPRQMYVMDYQIYQLRPYGINYRDGDQNISDTRSGVSKSLLRISLVSYLSVILIFNVYL